ncbi:hypothetical protein HG263_07055 [Pseudoalteromonas sp. JBTF-M23]|uniref:YCII-related domain-containing protein n=1 Tax=Pseudoalteromonas caenipelagi TaxID=2726988 RepID=A0A849V9M0_9GAMM|nr:YciI family protein [Pseudoalteromonas caenipelagi]NOU50299.1 hypothetical protein [Pseudoalteromonas caenipelagi]
MQYIITAYDYTDEDAIRRRLAVREQHFDRITALIQTGNFLSGGAMLDETGKMIGSSVHVEFSTREELDNWLNNDPYVTNNVWENIDIKEARLVPVEQYKNS